MICVILAAGKGTRMGDLSEVTPKPMLKVLGKTLLEHKILNLPEEIDEVIIVVGHLKNTITDFLGAYCCGKKISYVVQEELLGTAHSLLQCKNLLIKEKKFLVLMGDDIYSKEDLTSAVKGGWGIGVSSVANIKGKSKIVFDREGHIDEILEKYPREAEGYICTGMYVLSPKIFDYEMRIIPGGEFGLPQTILSAKKDFKIKALLSKFLVQVTTPEDLKLAEKYLKRNKI